MAKLHRKKSRSNKFRKEGRKIVVTYIDKDGNTKRESVPIRINRKIGPVRKFKAYGKSFVIQHKPIDTKRINYKNTVKFRAVLKDPTDGTGPGKKED